MSENNDHQALVEKVHKSVDRILSNAHMTEEEKVRALQEALQLIKGEDNNEVRE